MCADAFAIAQFAKRAGDELTAEKYLKKHRELKHCINDLLWDDWDYFRLSGLNFRGKVYTVLYDRNGDKYGVGKGLKIIESFKSC